MNKKGIVQESESTMTIKDDDGEEIILNVLRNPISLSDLVFEDSPRIDKKILTEPPQKKHMTASIITLSTDKITINMDKVKVLQPTARKRRIAADYEQWKKHSMIIFKHSSVYPFVHATNKYKCFICSKLFLEPSTLKDHTAEHNEIEMEKELDNKARNMNLKVDVTYLQCKICFSVLENFQNLKLHLQYHGKDIDPGYQDNLIPFRLGDKVFECQICNEKYFKLRLLVIHMNKHFNNFSCEVCGSVFMTLRLLRRHQETHTSGSFPCENCDKVFNTALKKRLHIRGVHLKQMNRRCPICSEKFSSNYQRIKHLRIVHNQTTGLFRCEVCGKEYDLKNHLLIHNRMVHLQEKNQECHICHARFFRKYVLRRHMMVHTGEKNYKCSVCGKAYARKGSLREHSKTHEIGCNACGQNCSGHANLTE